MQIKSKSNLPIKERISNLKKKIMSNAIELRKRIKNGTVFEFKPFSEKQTKVMTWWCDNSSVKKMNGIIADRSN